MRTPSSLLLLAALWGCGRDTAAPPAAPTQASAPVTSPPGSPPGARSDGSWRDLSLEELSHTMIWLNDIVIRHRDVQEFSVSFHYNGWISAAQPAERSRVEALALAQGIAERAQAGEDFAELARSLSDEPESSTRGGSLGGVNASYLLPWPGVLDAVSHLRPEEVSGVVETETGFHILQRRAAAAPRTAAGRHIVIAHDHAPWSARIARRPISPRTRREAWALGEELRKRATQHPADFAQLAAEYSDHRDAARGGDFGTWSTRELTDYPREVETLAALEVGQVAELIDTSIGVQIIQRVMSPPRERYAMRAIAVRFDPTRPASEPASQQSAHREAREIAVALRTAPERFAAFEQQAGGTGTVEIVGGRHDPALEALLSQLAPGQIAPEPIQELDVMYLIPRRLPTADLPALADTRFAL